MSTRSEKLTQEQRDEIKRLSAKHGALNVRLFGSFARGDAGSTSDLDLLIETGPVTTPWFPGGLIADLEALLGRHIDVVTERALNPKLRDQILREARPL